MAFAPAARYGMRPDKLARNILMSPEIAEQIAAIGRVIDPVKTGAIYAPLHDREPYAGVHVTHPCRRGVRHLPVAGDHDLPTRELAVVDIAPKGGVDACQALGRESQLGRVLGDVE